MENNTRISESCYSSFERLQERAETDSFNNGTGGHDHNQRNASATNREQKGNAEGDSTPVMTNPDNSKGQGDKGGQHIRGFGCSAYKS